MAGDNKYEPSQDPLFGDEPKKIEFTGVLDPGALYEALWDKMRGLDFTVHEVAHRKIVRGDATDYFIKWSCYRKSSSYVMFRFDINFELLNTKETEVMENGNKVKKVKGIWKVKFKPIIVTDWNGDWGKSRLKRWVRDWYDRFVFGRKRNNPILLAFGDYNERVIKLNDIAIIIMNLVRMHFGLPEQPGFQET